MFDLEIRQFGISGQIGKIHHGVFRRGWRVDGNSRPAQNPNAATVTLGLPHGGADKCGLDFDEVDVFIVEIRFHGCVLMRGSRHVGKRGF